LRKKPELHASVATDPFSHERVDDGDKSRDGRSSSQSAGGEKPSGWLSGVMRRLRGKD
jgi:hypothetical protein